VPLNYRISSKCSQFDVADPQQWINQKQLKIYVMRAYEIIKAADAEQYFSLQSYGVLMRD